MSIKQVSGEIETVPWETYEQGDNLKDCPSGFIDVLVKYGALLKALHQQKVSGHPDRTDHHDPDRCRSGSPARQPSGTSVCPAGLSFRRKTIPETHPAPGADHHGN